MAALTVEGGRGPGKDERGRGRGDQVQQYKDWSKVDDAMDERVWEGDSGSSRESDAGPHMLGPGSGMPWQPPVAPEAGGTPTGWGPVLIRCLWP
jgi:hypothetical protein